MSCLSNLEYEWIQVHPRDFFNYATLMRCLGKLAVAILDEMTNDVVLSDSSDEKPFRVVLDELDNTLPVSNYVVYFHDNSGTKTILDLSIPYNSLDRYPLYCTIAGEKLQVLDEDGNFVLTLSDLQFEEQ